MKIGPCATKNCEPRQVWKEAAVSKPLWVPQVNLIGANCLSIAWRGKSEVGARSLKLLIINEELKKITQRKFYFYIKNILLVRIIYEIPITLSQMETSGF